MPWRVIDVDGEVWHVQPAAERRANQSVWQLMLSFRAVSKRGSARAFWASFPIESTSKSSLFLQAERISDETLHELLCQHQP